MIKENRKGRSTNLLAANTTSDKVDTNKQTLVGTPRLRKKSHGRQPPLPTDTLKPLKASKVVPVESESEQYGDDEVLVGESLADLEPENEENEENEPEYEVPLDGDAVVHADGSLTVHKSRTLGPTTTTTRGPRLVRELPTQSNEDSIPGVISLSIPPPLRAQYASAKDRANLGSTPLRDYIASRLAACATHTAEKPLYFDDRARRVLERLAHRNFDTAEEVVGWLTINFSGVNVNDTPLSVEPELIARALARKDVDQSDSECLSEYLTLGIEIKTGLR
jgi:hypothetical protein